MKMSGVKVFLILVVAIGFVISVIFLLGPINHTSPEKIFIEEARSDLNTLWLAAAEYADQHQEKLPPDLDTLLQNDLYRTMIPSAIAQLKERVVYLGANRLYDSKNDRNVLAEYRWPLMGEAKIFDSEKIEIIVYSQKKTIIYDGNEVPPSEMQRRHEIPNNN